MIEKIELNNLGTENKNEVIILTDRGNFHLFFSYKTLVGIEYGFDGKGSKHYWIKSVIENLWSTTTGKLLNELEPNKKNRKSSEVFEKEVSEMFEHINS